MQRSASSSARVEEVASYAASGGQRGGRGRGRGGAQKQQGVESRACFTCNTVGHIAFDCPQNANVKKCHTCRRLGHEPSQCPGPRRGRGQGNSRGAAAAASAPQQQVAMIATTQPQQQ